MARKSPAGNEESLAHWLGEWLSERLPRSVPVQVQSIKDGRANVLVGRSAGPAIAVYGHLDTSLSGDAETDGHVTGLATPIPPARVDGNSILGLGAGVAKGPVAAGLAALVAVHRTVPGADVGALIVAGGTHRATPRWPADHTAAADSPYDMGIGVRAALDHGFRPDAVLNVKGGAPGMLYEEPGMVYVEVTAHDRYGAGLLREPGADMPGAPAMIAARLPAISQWRRSLIATAEKRQGQAGADVVLGAVAGGLAAKPDLLPDRASAFLCIVIPPGTSPEDAAWSLRQAVGEHASVTVYGVLPPGRTEPEHVLVQTARTALSASGKGRALGLVPDDRIRGWRGVTDGALLRALGIPTVRIGPRLSGDPEDPRMESVRIDDLVSFSRIFAEIMAGYVTSKDTIARSDTSGRNRSATNRS